MGILLGLLTALSWGSADFLARFATRKIGTFRTMLYMQLTGFLLLTAVLHWLGGWGHLADGSGWRPWAWGILVGVLNTFGTLALYRSFEIGKMSIVAPISASYPVLTMLLGRHDRRTADTGATGGNGADSFWAWCWSRAVKKFPGTRIRSMTRRSRAKKI